MKKGCILSVIIHTDSCLHISSCHSCFFSAIFPSEQSIQHRYAHSRYYPTRDAVECDIISIIYGWSLSSIIESVDSISKDGPDTPIYVIHYKELKYQSR